MKKEETGARRGGNCHSCYNTDRVIHTRADEGEKETQTNDICNYCMHVQEYECLHVCITML